MNAGFPRRAFPFQPTAMTPTATLEDAVEEVTEVTQSTKPVAKFSFRAISASVFQNKSKDGKTFYKTTLQRSFKVHDEVSDVLLSWDTSLGK